MQKKKTFQEALVAFIKNNGYTQRTLAEKVGVTHMAINYWCNGKHEPTLRDIKKLMAAGMKLEDIFG